MSDEKWPHAELAIKWYSAPIGTYEWCRKDIPLWESKKSPSFLAYYEYEIRPIRKMEIMPEARVPAPLREKPKAGTEIWVISSLVSGGIHRIIWGQYVSDDVCPDSGLAFATEQDARDFLAAITARREE